MAQKRRECTAVYRQLGDIGIMVMSDMTEIMQGALEKVYLCFQFWKLVYRFLPVDFTRKGVESESLDSLLNTN